MEPISSALDPARLLRRAPHDGVLGGIGLDWDAVRTFLDLDIALLNASILEMGGLAELLPLGTLAPAERTGYARRGGTGLPPLVAATTAGLALLPDLARAEGIDPVQVHDLPVRQSLYRGFQLIGERMKNAGMTARLLVAGFMSMLVEQVLDYLEARIDDPQTPRAEIEALLQDFGPALLLVDEMLQSPVRARQERGAARAALGEELKAQQAQAALDGVILAVRHGEKVPRQSLLEAARQHQKSGGADTATDHALPVHGPGGRSFARPGDGKGERSGAGETSGAGGAGGGKGPRIIR